MKFLCIFAFSVLVASQLASARVIDSIKHVGGKVQAATINIGKSIAENSAKVAHKIKDEVSKKPQSLDEIKIAVKNIGSEIKDGSAKVLNQLKTEIEYERNLEELKKAADVLIEKMKMFGNDVLEASKNVGQSIAENSGKVVTKVKDEISQKPQTVHDITNAIKNIGSEFANGSSAVLDQLKSEIAKSATFDEIKKVIFKAQERIEQALAALQERALDEFDDDFPMILGLMRNIV